MRSQNDLYPLMIGRVLLRSGRMICDTGHQKIQLTAPTALLESLFSLCTGRASLKRVLDEIEERWDRKTAGELIDGLFDVGVMVDAKDYPYHLWSFMVNPQCFGGRADVVRVRELARAANTRGFDDRPEKKLAIADIALHELLRTRKSERYFSGRLVSDGVIGALLWAGYGVLRREDNSGLEFRRTVSSAGALYPLSFYLVILKSSEELSCGIYRACFDAVGAVGVVQVSAVVEPIYRAYVDPQYLFQAQAAIVVVGTLTHTAEKYGSRAALYVALEAGHAAQNILLSAQEQNIASVEIGGFYEKHMSTALQLSDQDVVMTSILLGGAEADDVSPKILSEISFTWAEPPLNGATDFSMGRATISVRGDAPMACWGRSVEPSMAYVKAVAEAQERLACSSPQGLADARLDELNDALDPQEVVAYTPTQYQHKEFRFRPFDESARYRWKQGLYWDNGESVHVLAEQVYFSKWLSPSAAGLYTTASTSGVAAYPSLEGAFERALLEVIERDAFMRFWLNCASPTRILEASLPLNVQQKIVEYRERGFEICVCDMTLDTVPIILVFAQNSKMGWTTVTTSANYLAEKALEHAFMEMEPRIHERIGRKKSDSRIEPKDVILPADHQQLYSQRANFRRANFLVSASQVKKLSEVAGFLETNKLDKLLEALVSLGSRPICLDISLANRSKYVLEDLFVARAIIPGFLPMNFGYNTEALGMKRLFLADPEHGLKGGKKVFFKPLFPHPFA